ncbi:MAG: cation:proton antiporter domain-containing protein, partial [Alphaproteobacteria bacterium]
MNSQIDDIWLLMALAGAATVLAILIRRVFTWLGVPALVGYLLLGMLLATVNHWRPMLGAEALHAFEFLGSIGVFCLLFRIGLESNVSNLLAQLRRAIPVWIGNVLLSGVSAFLLARYLLDFALVPSL